MDLPPHPDRHDDQPSATTTNWVAVAVITIVIALVAVLVILHLAGVVGPGSS
jgi:hypothetical protein